MDSASLKRGPNCQLVHRFVGLSTFIWVGLGGQCREIHHTLSIWDKIDTSHRFSIGRLWQPCDVSFRDFFWVRGVVAKSHMDVNPEIGGFNPPNGW